MICWVIIGAERVDPVKGDSRRQLPDLARRKNYGKEWGERHQPIQFPSSIVSNGQRGAFAAIAGSGNPVG